MITKWCIILAEFAGIANQNAGNTLATGFLKVFVLFIYLFIIIFFVFYHKSNPGVSKDNPILVRNLCPGHWHRATIYCFLFTAIMRRGIQP